MSGQVLFPLLICAVGLGVPAVATGQPPVGEAYGNLPLHFEANRGQTSGEVRFLSRGPGYGFYLTHDAQAVLVLKQGVLRTTLAGAAPDAPVTGLDELPGKANYFIGNDPAKWRSNVPTYAKVQLPRGLPGHRPGLLRQPAPARVRLRRRARRRPAKDRARLQRLRQAGDRRPGRSDPACSRGRPCASTSPVIYQDIDGTRREIGGGYEMKRGQQIGFQVAAYDKTRPLVIDPVLSYSTYLGGSGLEEGLGSIAVEPPAARTWRARPGRPTSRPARAPSTRPWAAAATSS